METKKEKAAERVAVKRDAAVHKETVEACIEVARGAVAGDVLSGASEGAVGKILAALEGLLAD